MQPWKTVEGGGLHTQLSGQGTHVPLGDAGDALTPLDTLEESHLIFGDVVRDFSHRFRAARCAHFGRAKMLHIQGTFHENLL